MTKHEFKKAYRRVRGFKYPFSYPSYGESTPAGDIAKACLDARNKAADLTPSQTHKAFMLLFSSPDACRTVGA